MPEPQKQNVSQFEPVRRDQLFNRLNVMHFQNAPLMVCLRHRDHGHTIRVKASPEPVVDEHAVARWIRDGAFPEVLTAFDLESLILAGNQRTFQFRPERYWIDEEMISFVVPCTASEIAGRRHARYNCRAAAAIEATITQNTLLFSGRLLDYSVGGMLVELNVAEDQNPSWVNTDAPALLSIRNGGQIVYTGQVSLQERDRGTYLLTPHNDPAPRFRRKKYRARRQRFVPSPDLIFRHPVTGRTHNIKVSDLGSLGFAVEEREGSAVLIPGLLIGSAKLSFANSLCLACKVQVVYSRPTGEDGGEMVRSGLAILDIDLDDHLKLISLVQQAQDPQAYINNQVDPEDLFEFFFETGFLYPHKYVEIARSRDEFRKAYARLYGEGSDIGRHFVYQDAGRILGHFASLRVYRKTWLNHHHAAISGKRAGMRVVRAISEYINDSYLLNPANIEYIIGYFQANNRFPQRYFGDFVKFVEDRTKTSLDNLGYLSEAGRFGSDPGHLSGDWSLDRATAADIVEFRGFYDKISGGLLPDALDLTPQGFDDQTLAARYEASGLTRRRRLYALRHLRALKALVDIQDSDLGLNLSEITNATTLYVLDPEACHRDVLRFVVCTLAGRYDKKKHPVMFFPATYPQHYNIEMDKEYTLWALNVRTDRDGEAYMQWMNRFCR